MSRAEFIVPGEPVAKGRPRVSKRGAGVVLYTPEKTRKFEQKVHACARAKLAEVGPLPDGPLSITVTSVIKRPQRLMRKKDPFDRIRHTSKPDASNFLKAIEDGAEGTFYENDSRIAEAHVSKWYAAKGESPHTKVVVESLTP